MKKLLISSLLIVSLSLSGCGCMSHEELEAENQARKDHIMEVMKERLAEKYGDEYQASDFEISNLSKGGNQAWFNYGFYPATGTYKGEEFTVQLKTDGRKRFDDLEDGFYGVVYGKEATELLDEIVSPYVLEDVKFEYQPSPSIITDEKELKQNLRLTGTYTVTGDFDIDEVCELIDKIDAEGYQRWIWVVDAETNKKTNTRGKTSAEIRTFFEELK